MAQDPTLQGLGRTVYDEMLALLPEEPTFWGAVAEAGKQTAAGAAGVGASLLKLPRTIGKGLKAAGVDIDSPGLEGLAREMGEAGDTLAGMAPAPDPTYSGGATGFFTQDVPQGIGSGLSFLGAGLLTGGSTAAIALTGAATAYVSGYEEMSRRDDVPEDKKWIYALGQGGMGLTEAIPIGRLLSRLNARTGGGVRRVLWSIVENSFEESVQEGSQELWQNFLRESLTPDEWRGLHKELSDVGYAALVGGVAGGLTAGGAHAVLDRVNRTAAEEPAPGPLPRPEDVLPELAPVPAAPAGDALPAEAAGAGASEGGAHPGLADAEVIGKAVDSPAFQAHGLSGLDAETRGVVESLVLRQAEDDEVLDAVVELLPVDVVNALGATKDAAKVRLHDRAVLQDLLAGAGDPAVPGLGDVSGALVRGVAAVAAKRAANDLAGRAAELKPAAGTLDDGHGTPPSGDVSGATGVSAPVASTTLQAAIRENEEWGSPAANPSSARTTPPVDPQGVFKPIAPNLRGIGESAKAVAPKTGPISSPAVQDAFAAVVEAAGKSVPFRVGRLAQRSAAGVFKVGPEVIRIREAGDLPTAAHEMAHALEKAIYGFPKGGPWTSSLVGKPVQDELTKLGHDLYGATRPAGGYKREGWAEFIRLWLTENALARSSAPATAAWFEGTFLAENEPVAKAMQGAAEALSTWQTQGPQARAEASIVDPTSPANRTKEAVATVRQSLGKVAWVEMGEPIRQLSEMAQERLGEPLAPSKDPWALYEGLRLTHDARAERMVTEAMLDLAGNRVGQGLEQALAPVKGQRRDFTLYLWGKQAQLYWNDPGRPEGRNPGLSRQDADAIVAELQTPEFQVAESLLREWHEGVLNYAAQASPAFAKVVERVHESHPGYLMPLQREFDDLDDIWKRAARRSAGQATNRSPVQAMRGSGRRIKEPFQAMISNARAVLLKAHQRAVLDAVIGLSKVEGMGGLVEKVPHDQVPAASRTIQDLIDEIGRKIKPAGTVEVTAAEDADLSDLLGQTLTFFAPAQQPNGQDPILPYWNGESVDWYYVDGGLYRALAGMDTYRLPAIIHWTLGSSARALRLGTTGLRAAFSLVTNPIRDLQVFGVNTRSAVGTPHLLASWFHQMGHAAVSSATGNAHATPELRAWLDLGGSIAQSLGQDVQHTRRAARRLFETRKQRVLDPRNWVDFTRDLFQFPESASRATEIALLAKEIGWEPGTPMSVDQSIEFLRAGKRVTTDFSAAGEYARVANQMIPFLNASIQGLRAHINAAEHHPGRFFFRGLGLAALTLAMWWRYKDDDWYTELTARERFGFWHFQLGDEIVRIPRAFEVGALFAALPEAMADGWYRQDPDRAKEWFAHMFEVSTPPYLPVPAREAAEQLANRDFYTEAPIVPQGEQMRPPEEQYGEYTSKLAVFLGDVFEVSPRRIDHAIRGVFGGLGPDVIEGLGLGPDLDERESEPSDLPVVGRLFMRGGTAPTRPQSVEDLWDTLDLYQRRQHSTRVEETPQQRVMRLQLTDATRAISALSWVRSKTHDNEDRRKISNEILRITREALRAEREGDLMRGAFTAERKRAEAQEAATRRARGAD